MKYLILICHRLTDLLIGKKENSRFLTCLLAGTVLAGVVFFPFASWGDAEGQNLRSSTLRQYDFLIARVNKGEPFDPPSQKVVDKIAENLETLSSYQIGSIKKREFRMVSVRLYTAVEDWGNGQLMDARHHLLKSKALLASFSF